VVEGIFYPDSPETLSSRLASWGLKDGGNHSGCGGQAIIAPHGAWDLTGNIAGAAFAAAQKEGEKSGRRINKVLLLGACHCSDEEGIYLSESSFFETPLGDIPVDRKLNRELASCSTLIKVNDLPHLSEHSLEVLLPLVKYCFPAAKIVPIIMSGSRPVLISGLAKALRAVFQKNMEESLVVISSTVSQNPDPALALSVAEEFRSILEHMDTQAFLSCLAAGRISACGAALVGALLESGLLTGKQFVSLCPLAPGIGDKGETVYYGAFISAINTVG
jgi:AmmeMemoRadiSam system protein B